MVGDVGEKGDPRHGERRPSESVVVDIGGTVGALVVTTTHALDGAEIEICPVGSTSRTHTIVRAREVPGCGLVYAGVFPSLPEGDYTVLAWGSLPEAVVRIDGGSVTQFTW
ncbi:MAG: phospholipase [Actinomycetota bacterium]|nr:phospholipase [Actinomycetota bacterium]